jgi:hypothetical protein
MIQGDLVRLRTKYPIWLYSYGLSDGDLGIIIKEEKDVFLVYWIKIKKTSCIEKNLIQIVE